MPLGILNIFYIPFASGKYRAKLKEKEESTKFERETKSFLRLD
jgi:hypothetical protein